MLDRCLVNNLLNDDLEQILQQTKGLWEDLRGKRLFMTGGSGFFGRWLLESFAWANAQLALDAAVLVLTRDPDAFRAGAPHLAANPAIELLRGDIRTFDFPEGRFDSIIHAAATSAAATYKGEDALVKFDVVVNGTRHALDFAVHCGARRFLFTSSGAVYGHQSPRMTHVPEEYQGAPDPCDVKSAWGISKKAAEFLCIYYSQRYGFEVKIARCFSFVGPHLPLDLHYAIGNFIRDGLQGGPIHIKGDGTPYRSYLYAADLAVWLWTLLFRGESCVAYNVGAETALSIEELAHTVAGCFDYPVDVTVAKERKEDAAPDRYVPSTKLAQQKLGLTASVDLKDAIRNTIVWNRLSDTRCDD